MKTETHTCPLTGASFDAVHLENSLVAINPLNGAQIAYPIRNGYIMVPLWSLEEIETLTPVQAADYLDVSRQRIDQLAATNKICQRYVNGSPVFLKSDVVEYKNNRKNGRPRKE